MGCSTGEEAWSLALLAAHTLRAGGATQVTAVDRSREALAVAQAAVYAAPAPRGAPFDGWLAPRLREGRLELSAQVPVRPRFVLRDVMQGVPRGPYDLVLCKNVLIYFGAAAAKQLVGSIFGALEPGGMLVVARSEVPIVRALGHAAVALGPELTAFTR